MSASPPLHVLRAAFQACRPRSSVRVRGGTGSTSMLWHRQHQRQRQQQRHHSSDRTTSYSPPSSSVSQEEVSHFSRLASSWWDPYGPSRLLHLMNPLRHDFISTCLQTDPSHDPNVKKTYLDIGCGGGIFASSAARKPHTESVTAIDPTPEVIAVAKAQQRSDPTLAEPKLTYLNCAIEDLTAISTSTSTSTLSSPSQTAQEVESKQYDIVTLFEVIEHIDRPAAFLDVALRHLKPNGWLFGSTISRHPISYLTTKLIAEAPLIGVVPAGTHDWNKYIRPDELRAWFEKENNNFGSVRIEGVVYVPVLGWKFVSGSEEVGNYFFGVQKLA